MPDKKESEEIKNCIRTRLRVQKQVLLMGIIPKHKDYIKGCWIEKCTNHCCELYYSGLLDTIAQR